MLNNKMTRNLRVNANEARVYECYLLNLDEHLATDTYMFHDLSFVESLARENELSFERLAGPTPKGTPVPGRSD